MVWPSQYAQVLSDSHHLCTPASQTELAYQLQWWYLSEFRIAAFITKRKMEEGPGGLPKFPGLTRILSKHSDTRNATDGAKWISATRGIL